MDTEGFEPPMYEDAWVTTKCNSRSATYPCGWLVCHPWFSSCTSRDVLPLRMIVIHRTVHNLTFSKGRKIWHSSCQGIHSETSSSRRKQFGCIFLASRGHEFSSWRTPVGSSSGIAPEFLGSQPSVLSIGRQRTQFLVCCGVQKIWAYPLRVGSKEFACSALPNLIFQNTRESTTLPIALP